MEIDEIIKQLKTYTPERIEEELLRIIRQHEPEIVDLNIQQLMEGKNSKGESLGEYASKAYAELKRHLNPKGVVDLKFEGDFHQSIYLETGKFPVHTNASDPKTGKLVTKYGEDILNTPEERKEELANDIIGSDVKDLYAKIFDL